MQDTCKRVGGDPARKLSAQDRLIGASSLVMQTGETPVYIAIGCAAGLHRLVAESGLEQNFENGKASLLQTSGLAENDPLTTLILEIYSKLLAGETLAQLGHLGQTEKAAHRHNVI